MGNKHSLSEWKDKFGKREYNVLYKMFEGLAAQSVGKTVDKFTFLRYFDFPGMLGERLFKIFDQKKNNVIDIEEFMNGMGAFMHGTTDEKMRLLFEMYDLAGNNVVSREELTTMLLSLVSFPQLLRSLDDGDDQEQKRHNKSDADTSAMDDETVVKQRDAVARVVDKAFASCKLDKDGNLDYDAFESWARQNPVVMQIIEKSFAKHLWNRSGLQRRESRITGSRTRHRSTVGGGPDRFGVCQKCKWECRFCPACGMQVDDASVPTCINKECAGGGGPIFAINGGKVSFCLQCGDQWQTATPKGRAHSRRKSTGRGGSARPNVAMQGKLSKVRKHLKTLKEQYYVLRNNFLYVFESSKDKQPAKAIFLEGLFIELPETDDRASDGYFGFELVSLEHTFMLYAHSKKERQQWVRMLRKSAKHLIIDDYYELGGVIGEGRFATVRSAIRMSDGRPFAVKIIDKNKVDDANGDSLRDEIAILKLLKHPYIVQFEDVFESPTHIYIVLAWIQGGDMLDLLKNVGHLTERVARNVIAKTLSVLHYLHLRGVVHRDIKPENVLVGNANDPELSNIYLADFGLSSFASPQETMSIACGTLSYMAPEMLLLEGYTKAVDMWGVGILAYILLSGCKPFYHADRDQVIDLIIDSPVQFEKPADIWSGISAEAKDFIVHLLDKDPKKRFDVDQARKHPWMKLDLGTGMPCTPSASMSSTRSFATTPVPMDPVTEQTEQTEQKAS